MLTELCWDGSINRGFILGGLQNIWGWLESPSLVQVQYRWIKELISYLSLFEYYHRKERGERGVIIVKHILLLLHIHISRSFISFLHIFSAFSCCSKRRGLLQTWKPVPNPTPKGNILGLDLVNSRFTLFLKGGDWIRLSESLFGPISRTADEIWSDSESDMDRLCAPAVGVLLTSMKAR